MSASFEAGLETGRMAKEPASYMPTTEHGVGDRSARQRPPTCGRLGKNDGKLSTFKCEMLRGRTGRLARPSGCFHDELGERREPRSPIRMYNQADVGVLRDHRVDMRALSQEGPAGTISFLANLTSCGQRRARGPFHLPAAGCGGAVRHAAQRLACGARPPPEPRCA